MWVTLTPYALNVREVEFVKLLFEIIILFFKLDVKIKPRCDFLSFEKIFFCKNNSIQQKFKKKNVHNQQKNLKFQCLNDFLFLNYTDVVQITSHSSPKARKIL